MSKSHETKGGLSLPCLAAVRISEAISNVNAWFVHDKVRPDPEAEASGLESHNCIVQIGFRANCTD